MKTAKYVVPSAPGRRDADDAKVTDLLYACHTLAAEGRAHEFEETFSAIRERYLGIVEELGLSPECIATQLEQARFAILSGMGPDYAASRGEFLNGPAALGVPGLGVHRRGGGHLLRRGGPV